MTSIERIIKAKIGLLINEPWFGQLACYLNLKEMKHWKDLTAAIDERGNLYFNPEWIKDLSDKEMMGLMCHEIMHLAYEHPFRCQSRNLILWNIAADLKINSDLIYNRSYDLPKGGLLPSGHEWTLGKIQIKNIDQKTTEQIYDDLYSKVPSSVTEIIISLDGSSSGTDNLDKLPEPWKGLIKKLVKDLQKTNADKLKPAEIKQLAREWKERVNSVNQTMKGNIPAGLARELLDLENPQLPWHQIIRQRFSKLEKLRTWRRPNKKWLPYFFPGTEKNKTLKAAVAIDTSGSMSAKDITKAISETWGLANSFRSFKLYIIFNDADVWDVVEVSNGNKEKIRRLQPKGGGGTLCKPVFDMIKSKFRNRIDSLVYFTDGYISDEWPKHQLPYSTYFVTSSNDVYWPSWSKVIHLKS